MKWVNNLKITFKVAAGFIIMLILMSYIGINAFINLGRMNKYLGELYSNHLLGIDYLVEADRDLQQLLIAERTLMLSKNNPKLFKDMIAFHEENLAQSAVRFAKYKALPKSEDENKIIARYENKRIEWEKATREVIGNIGSADQKDFSASLALSLHGAKTKFDDMRDEIDILEDITLGMAKKKIAEGEAIYKKNIIILISVISIAVLFAIVMGIVIIRSIKYRINSINNIIKDISEGEGDLTMRIIDIGYDEFKSLGFYFNKFMNTLEKLVVSTKKSSQQVENISMEVSSGNNQLSSSTQELASNVEEITANIKEFVSSINDTASGTATMTKNILSIAEKAEAGSKMLENVTEAMTSLKDSGEQIGAIVDVVNEIAFQINLLALNAAVEAAHAGDGGKGFAVVAVEVRNLAARSTEAVRKIKNLVTQNHKYISNIDKVSRESVETLMAVVSGIYDTRKGVREIEDMSFKQASGIEQINIAITQIDKGIQENAAYVEELAGASENMNNVARELTDYVQRFKVSAN